MEDSLSRLKSRVSGSTSALQLLEEITTFETILMASQINWEKQSYVLDLCMDGYSSVDTAQSDLEEIVRHLHRSGRRRSSSPKLEEILREIISLPKPATKQSMFLSENSAQLDIAPLLTAVSHLQDECQEASQEVVRMQEELFERTAEDVEMIASTEDISLSCQNLLRWIEESIENLQQVNLVVN